jgi:hypothetical protein
MPLFKSTYNILTKVDEDEVFNPNWMDSDTIILPPNKDWDYARELQIEDVNIWEVIFEYSGVCLYASWDPYAEFYLLTVLGQVETFYGNKCQQRLYKRLKELNISFDLNDLWVDNDTLKYFK